MQKVSVLKAMAAKGIKQCHLFLLYQSVVLMQCHWLWTRPHNCSMKNMPKLDRVQNEAMRVILGTSHQCKPDRKWSRSKYTSVPLKIPTTHTMKP